MKDPKAEEAERSDAVLVVPLQKIIPLFNLLLWWLFWAVWKQRSVELVTGPKAKKLTVALGGFDPKDVLISTFSFLSFFVV